MYIAYTLIEYIDTLSKEKIEQHLHIQYYMLKKMKFKIQC